MSASQGARFQRSVNKKSLSESDICDKFVRPAMEAAGWDGMLQIYREYPLRAGRVVVRGRAHEFAQFAFAEGDVVRTLDRPIISSGLNSRSSKHTTYHVCCCSELHDRRPMPKSLRTTSCSSGFARTAS